MQKQPLKKKELLIEDFEEEEKNDSQIVIGQIESVGQSSVATSQANTFLDEPPCEYETIIQKLETDVRTHIWQQNTLKIHLETLQWRNDELEAADKENKEWIQTLQKELDTEKAWMKLFENEKQKTETKNKTEIGALNQTITKLWMQNQKLTTSPKGYVDLVQEKKSSLIP